MVDGAPLPAASPPAGGTGDYRRPLRFFFAAPFFLPAFFAGLAGFLLPALALDTFFFGLAFAFGFTAFFFAAAFGLAAGFAGFAAGFDFAAGFAAGAGCGSGAGAGASIAGG
jgi:hypothetical protein